MIRLVIVDDDPMVRTGIRLILGGEPDLEVVGEAGNGLDAEAVIRECRPDVALIDIRMPVQDGLTTIEHLMARPEPPHVIVLTTFDADEPVMRALGAGASGFLLKDTPPERVIDAIRSVSRGEPILSPTITRHLIVAATSQYDPTRTRGNEVLASLTEREREVAIAVARGQSNAEIAETLYMSIATVKATVTRVFTKLEVDNRVHIAMKVRDAGLLC